MVITLEDKTDGDNIRITLKIVIEEKLVFERQHERHLDPIIKSYPKGIVAKHLFIYFSITWKQICPAIVHVSKLSIFSYFHENDSSLVN
jgi:hypothetical protein